MVYHSASDKRLKTITFPFDNGTNPTYYIPVTSDDLLNESDVEGYDVSAALNAISASIDGIEEVVLPITNDKIDALFA